MAILSFRDEATADLHHGRNTSRARRFPSTILKIALRKLDVINGAHKFDDLRSPPANHLEALKGDLSRIVQKPQPTENRAKKAANRPLLIPRMVFEKSELWEFN